MNKKVKILIAQTCLILGLTYLNVQDSVLQTSHYSIENEKLPVSFNGLKIAQISDFHNVEIKFLRDQIVRKLKEEAPNIIVITGDFIDYARTNI